jgi:hypothetical protein
MPKSSSGAKKPPKPKKVKKSDDGSGGDGGGGGKGGGRGMSVAELIQKKKMVVYRSWLQLTNLSLVLLGAALLLIAVWFGIQYGAGSVTGKVALGGLICAFMGALGFCASQGSSTLLFGVRPLFLCLCWFWHSAHSSFRMQYCAIMGLSSLYCGWGLVILLLFHRDDFESTLGDVLDNTYKQMEDYETRISGEEEIAKLSTRYSRTTYTVMLAASGATFVGAYTSGQLLGFRKLVKRFLQGVNLGLVGMSAVMSVSASYVHRSQTFAGDDAQLFVGALILAGVMLGVTSGIGLYAVKYEHGRLSIMVSGSRTSSLDSTWPPSILHHN